MKRIINKLKRFFFITKESISNPSYYKEITKASFWFSFRYHVFLLFVISLILGAKFAVQIAAITPTIPQFIQNAKAGARELYPRELILNIKDGNLSTNVKEPYVINLPKVWGDLEGINFITIDTKANVEDIQNKNTAILVTNDVVAVPDDNAGYKFYSIKEFTKDEEIVITRSEYDKVMDQALPYLDYLPGLAVIFILIGLTLWPIIGTFGWLIMNLIWFLIIGVILFVIAKVMKKNLSYGKVYQMLFHASVLPILINLILGFFTSTLPPFLGTGIIILFMTFVVSKFSSN